MSGPAPRTFDSPQAARAYLLEVSNYTRKLARRSRDSLLREMRGAHEWVVDPDSWTKEEIMTQMVVDAYPWKDQQAAQRAYSGAGG